MTKIDQAALAYFLDAWTQTCLHHGRRSLSARSAISSPGLDLQKALDLLGYPEALSDSLKLSGALRTLQERRDTSGRYLCRSAGGKGISQWYVIPIP